MWKKSMIPTGRNGRRREAMEWRLLWAYDAHNPLPLSDISCIGRRGFILSSRIFFSRSCMNFKVL